MIVPVVATLCWVNTTVNRAKVVPCCHRAGVFCNLALAFGYSIIRKDTSRSGRPAPLVLFLYYSIDRQNLSATSIVKKKKCYNYKYFFYHKYSFCDYALRVLNQTYNFFKRKRRFTLPRNGHKFFQPT